MSKFLTVFCGLLLFASPLYAQDNKVYIGENDTIRYSYTPLQTDSIPASQPSDTLAAAPKKKSFWRRLIDYFGESSTDKTFEKRSTSPSSEGRVIRKTLNSASRLWLQVFTALTARIH